MICGGVSIQGGYHEVNQDSYVCRMYKTDGYVMVVSDGVGSKRDSQHGSRAICESVCQVLSTWQGELNRVSFMDILSLCHERWKKNLADYDISQCCATMLVLVAQEGRIRAARLGDGFLAVYTDQGIRVLYDRKTDYFANETDCLREELDREHLEILEEPYEVFYGAVSCTDGIEIGTMQEEELREFARDFITEYSSETAEEIQREVHSWVEEWPGWDDKTLAFLLESKEI